MDKNKRLLRLRDRCIELLPAVRFSQDFLSLVGTVPCATKSVLYKKESDGFYVTKHRTCSWYGYRMDRGLGALLYGFFDTTKVEGRAHNDVRNRLIFIILLWDWLRGNPWLKTFSDNQTLAIQCENDLAYWEQWKRVVEIMHEEFPDLWKSYACRAGKVNFFFIKRRDHGQTSAA